jgi:hypothetical protein
VFHASMYITVLSPFKLNVISSICQDTVNSDVITGNFNSVSQRGRLQESFSAN